jgi:hypothetical protein
LINKRTFPQRTNIEVTRLNLVTLCVFVYIDLGFFLPNFNFYQGKFIMRKIFVVLFVLFFLNVSNAQVIGEIFDKAYADQEFGNVLSYIEIENDDLAEMLKTSGEYIMLNIETGTIRAIDAQRKSVQGSAVSNEEVF